MPKERILRAYDQVMIPPFVKFREGQYPSLWSIAPHRHDFIQILCIMAGEGEFETTQAYSFAAGDIVVVGAQVAHHWRVNRGSNLVIGDVCVVDCDVRHHTILGPLVELAQELPGGIIRGMGATVSKFAEAHRSVRQPEAFADYRLHGLLWQLVADIAQAARTQRDRLQPGPIRESTMVVLDRFMTAHYAKRVTLDDLAEAVHVSAKHLCRVVNRERGRSPMQLLNDVRMHMARQALSEQAWSVSEVGLSVGISDHRHFSRLFKTATGLTPTAYRQSQIHG